MLKSHVIVNFGIINFGRIYNLHVILLFYPFHFSHLKKIMNFTNISRKIIFACLIFLYLIYINKKYYLKNIYK